MIFLNGRLLRDRVFTYRLRSNQTEIFVYTHEYPILQKLCVHNTSV